MKTSTLTSSIAALAVGATLALGGPALASHGSDDGPGDDHGRHHGGRHSSHGDDDHSRGDDHDRRHRGRGSDDGRHDGRHEERHRHHRGGDDDRRASRSSSGDDDGRVQRGGRCEGGARWELKAKDEDGGIEWEFEVDSHRAGQTWQVLVARDGDRVFAGRRTTTGRSGSFSVERTVRDTAGQDTFTAFATRAGQTCRGSLVY